MAISYDDYKNKYGQQISKKRNEDWEKIRKLNQVQNTPKTVPNARISPTNDIANNLIKKRQEQVLETVQNKQRTTPIDASRNFTPPVAKNNPLQQMNDTIEATKKSPLNNELKKVISQNTEDTKWNKIPIIAGKTIGNTSAGITRGLLDTAESVLIDAPMTLGLSVAENIDRLVNGKVNENRRKKITDIINRDLSTEAMEKIGWTEEFYDEMEKDSLITRNNIGGKVVEGIGGMIPSIMTGGSSKALSYAMLGARSFGGGSEEALSNDASTNDAILYGIGKSATEIATEWLTGGIPGVKGSKGGLDKLVARGLGLNDIDEISRSLTKEIIKSGYKIAGEAGEEALAEIITPILKNATYSQGEKVDWNAVIESAIIGGITGGVLNAPADISNYRSSINGTNTISNQNNIETSSINQNEISLPSVETTNQEVNVQQNLEKLSAKPNVLDNNIVLPKVKYQVTLTENPKINNFRQSVSNYFDNTPTTHDLVNTIEKIINDKDYNVLFDDTILNKKGETVNAQITNNNKQIEIKINPNSERAGEFLLMHEITHAIETDSMKQLVMNYASKNAGFNEALENLKRTYGTTEVTDEVLADISGQLFGNQEFINSLTFENTTQSKSMIKKIYESIMKVLNKLTTKGRYRNFVQDLEVKWREAYRNTTTEQAISNLNNETRYAQKTLKDGTQYIETEKNLFIKEDGSPMSQREIYNSLVGKKITFNDGITATIKQWLPNNKNMYNELFKRYPNYKNVNDIKSVNKNINENIIELLENSDNISPNEPDYMNRHKDNKISSFDTRKVSFYDGKNAYDLDFSIAQMQDGNYVAYAKRNLSANNELLNKIKKEAPTSKSRGVLPYVDNITQNNNNVNSDISSTKYSMQENQNNTQDNHGRTLTKEQQEYFKNSKVRDENGNLLTVYHGTNNDFTIFENDFIGKNTNNEGIFGKGFYFTEKKSLADGYNRKDGKLAKDGSGKTMELYLDMKNPFYWNSIDTKEKMESFIEEMGIPKYVLRWNNTLKNQMAPITDIKAERKFSEILQKNGYDGVIYKYDDNVGEYVVFNSNQIKNVDNTNPTSDADIRYSQQDNNWQKHLEENYESTGTKTDMNRIKLPTAKNKIPTYKDFEIKEIPKDPTKESTYDSFKEEKKTRKEVQVELKQEMGITLDDIQVGKDINSIDFQRTDPIRVNEKVFGYEVGKKINDATINKTKHNEAERTRFLNKERSEIKELGIKARSKESAAVQKYGEKKYVNQYGEEVKYDDKKLAQEFPDIETQNKIKNAAKILRNKYDNYIEQINGVITELGYDPIPKRPDYMRHFQELDDKLSKWGIPLNPTDLNKENIPTDINGLTDQFKPGKNWFASAMARKGLKTTYDAITGIDGYLEGASNLMYHTADIQRYRTLSKFIRETYGQTHGLDNVGNMTEEQVQQRIDDVYNNKLSKYVAWLDEQANALAGKKGGIDRAAERILGRKIYAVLDTAKKQVGSNMTGFNVRSALTNFASSVQGASKTNKIAFVKGTISTVQNIVHNDGLIDKSDFLTNRFGSDQLSKKLWQKASNAGQILMSGSDYFTANQIWRSKYFENLQKGMSETEAIKNADDFSSRVMGDRSKGSTAEIFNSKTLGLLTQFQLEVNNQWSSIVHDNKMDIKSGNKSGATVLFQLGQLAAMSYMFNNLMKSLTGTDVMIDPIDMLKKIIGSDDDKEKTLEERAQEVLGDLVNDLPFASTLTGGRIPISEAFTGANTLFKKVTGGTDNYGNEIKWEDVKDDVISSAFYWLLPTGYGQLKKTYKGASMYESDKPIPGSYTASDNLRFNADTSTGGKIKAALFGEYSSSEAQKYIDSGFKAISKSRLQEMEDLGMTASEYRKYRSGLSAVGTTNTKKIEYIANSNYSNKQKNIMAKDLLKRDFDIKEYEKYDSYEEYDYAYKNPEKYSVIKQITSFDKYNTYKEKIDDIRANTTNDKTEIIKYINSLNLSIPQKAMFIRMYYPSFDNYNKQIINYVNSQNMTVTEKTKVLEKLGFTVRNGRVY